MNRAEVVDLAAHRPCVRHCTVCEGQDHHWLPHYDEDEDTDGTGEMVLACKHCDARKLIPDDWEE